MKYAATVSAALLTLASVSLAQDPATMPTTEPTPLPTTMPTSAPSIEATTTPATAPTSMPSTSPTTQASNVPPAYDRSKLLPGGYAILNTRSIFMKGRVSIPPAPGVSAATTPPPPTVPTARPEHKIVFVGVTETDGTASAMFEDTAAGKIISAKLNESIASGKVTSISLDEVTYTADGKPTKVLIGQAIDGTDGPAASSRVAITDNGNGPPTTGPIVAPAGSTGSTDAALSDVIERMRARRRAGQ